MVLKLKATKDKRRTEVFAGDRLVGSMVVDTTEEGGSGETWVRWTSLYWSAWCGSAEEAMENIRNDLDGVEIGAAA